MRSGSWRWAYLEADAALEALSFDARAAALDTLTTEEALCIERYAEVRDTEAAELAELLEAALDAEASEAEDSLARYTEVAEAREAAYRDLSAVY